MKSRDAHSLIEMLVVLIIVGVLIAIIVPAVQRSRESARMAQCISHQAELAKAVHLYVTADRFGHFPGFRYQASDGGSPEIGWAAQLFKYLGRNDLDPTQASFIEVLACPSDSGPRDTARMNYVANGGQAGIDSAADGIFFDHAKPVAERVYISKDDFRDGLTNTILLAENLDATSWDVTDEENQCILWPLTAGNEVNAGTGARPSSHHPGGFVAAFADGSVKFMAESEINDDANVHTENSVYVALLTPGGDDAVSGGAGSGGTGGSGPPDEPTGPCGLTGTYYEGDNWSGTSESRVEPTLMFPFGSGVYDNSVPYDIPLPGWTNPNSPLPLWTASFVGRIKADITDTYRFRMSVDNTVWVYVDGVEIAHWDPQTVPQLYLWVETDPVDMTAGQWVDIEVRFREWANASGTGPTGTPSHVGVQWETDSMPMQEIPCENMRTD